MLALHAIIKLEVELKTADPQPHHAQEQDTSRASHPDISHQPPATGQAGTAALARSADPKVGGGKADVQEQTQDQA